MTDQFNGQTMSQMVESTFGRMLFNEILPQNLGFVNRSIPGNELQLEVDTLVDKKKLGQIIEKCININGISETARVLDQIKAMGYHASTRSGISIGVFDMIVPDVKKSYIQEAEATVDRIHNMYLRGLLNDEGRKAATIKVWRKTTDDITEALKESLPADNPIFMMSDSGARGSMNQIKQLAGMRGNMAATSGEIIEIPIKSNLREGMNVLEFFISSHGARKALSDTALKTADSGYLTRRLVDVAQDVIIHGDECGTDEYIEVAALMTGSGAGKRVLKPLHDRIIGRNAALDVVHPESGEIIVKANGMITGKIAEAIEAAGITKVAIRSVLTCQARHGVCSRCYGMNLASGQPTVQGEAVGVMAAQSIGEPGTQLTMRTFHTGGIASNEDITQGLPRVEELFEARKPKGQAIMSQYSGIVRIEETDNSKREVTITDGETLETGSYSIPFSAPLLVENGDFIEAGDLLTDGSVNPHDIMKIKGVKGVQNYIISEVIRVYKNNGVEINDKHVEIITRQMMRKVRIDNPGETDLMTGSMIDLYELKRINEEAVQNGLQPAEGKRVLLGITKASLATDSFLSSASFQETTRVLTDAAVKKKVDPLMGLKENVIIGKLIPAGTGIKSYRNVTPVPNIEDNRHLIEAEGMK
jgi:DNA-directed RNA polymerase subunit beta'